MCQRNVVVRQFPPQRERFLSPKFPPHRLARAVTRSCSGETSPPLRNPIRLRFIGEQRHRHHFSFFWRQCFPFRPARLPLLSSPLLCTRRNVFQRLRWQAVRRFASCRSCHGLGSNMGVKGKGDKDKRELAPSKDRAEVRYDV